MQTLGPAQRVINGGTLVMTQGINDWIATGLEQYASEPNENCLGFEWRRHHIAVIVSSHLAGDQGDTCSEDHLLNQEVFHDPGCGGRIVTLWFRNHTAKIFCITDNFGGLNAVTTVMFAAEY